MAKTWEMISPLDPKPSDQINTGYPSTGHAVLQVAPGTDIWRPDEGTDVWTAPCLVSRIKATEFSSFKATVSADWKTLYDQGGIVIAFPTEAGGKTKMRQWVKAGIEVFEGAPKLGVVGTYAFSDWSLAPMLEEGQEATFEAVRDGTTLWIYALKGSEKFALREIKWAFLEERRGDVEMIVGVYGAKPTPDAQDSKKHLEVSFKGIELPLAL